MKKFTFLILVLIIIINSITAYAEEPVHNGEHYILMEEKSGRILLEKNAHKKMPMASTTKIMTALVALEQGNPDDEVEIKGSEVNIEGSSIYLKDGEVVKLIDLIYGLMLRSGNDAALAIANHISGSEENFVELMNRRAKEIGALNTNFANPHGLHNENHYSTAYDLALITKEAFSNKEFEEISKAKNYRSSREVNGYFVNKNKTLWDYEGGDGVKIGYTLRAGRCLVSSASRNDMRLIAVTLNNYNWFDDNYKLFDYGFENYELKKIYDKNQLITQVDIKNGEKEKLPLVVDKDLLYPFKEEEKGDIKIVIKGVKENITAPVQKGDKIGSVEVFFDGKLVRKDNLVAQQDIKRINIIQRLLRGIKTKNS